MRWFKIDEGLAQVIQELNSKCSTSQQTAGGPLQDISGCLLSPINIFLEKILVMQETP
ncbi:hypothetical protein DPMN_042147 [Dreissena polymorpha]|uniref:Uncharacterized protein n=1 Tax=Dreissena polymorpha TaxID=45954 RepID=A0A9D4D006_DREPO|nr:hypothetical protein DPMN_042147 [Dreissena polymorpha]